MKDPTGNGDGGERRGGAWAPEPAVLLAVDADPILDSLAPLPERTRVVRVRYRDLGPELIARTLPDCIVAPLIAADFDAVELAQRVCGYGYRGRLVVCTEGLPDGRLVRAELTGACKGLTVDLLDLGPRS